MPVPFVGRAAKGGGGRKHAPVAPGITFDPFDTTVGTKNVTIRATGGITHVGYAVVADSPPNYPWYDPGTDNIALVNGAVTLSITTFNAGDFIKAFKSAASPIGSASRDFSIAVDSPKATGTAAPPSSPGVVSRIQVLHRGQSNAYFGDQYGGAGALAATLASLTTLPVDMVSRRDTTNSTLHSGTATYYDNGQPYDNCWLNAFGNYSPVPEAWGNRGPMTDTLGAVQNHVSSDPAVPLYDLPVHSEYDQGMPDAAARAAYGVGSFEPCKRIRAARPKNAGKHVLARGYMSYGYNWLAIQEMRSTWFSDLSAPDRNAIMACGCMHDCTDSGDFSHWAAESPLRIYSRIAFRLARDAWDRGWVPSGAALADCPSLGPRITSGARVGNSITLTVAHDKGANLVAGANGVNWGAFTCSPANNMDSHVQATGGAILSATSVRVDFPSQPPASGRVWHAVFPDWFGRGLIRDNWHASHPSKYDSVPNIGSIEFPLQATLSGVTYT